MSAYTVVLTDQASTEKHITAGDMTMDETGSLRFTDGETTVAVLPGHTWAIAYQDDRVTSAGQPAA